MSKKRVIVLIVAILIVVLYILAVFAYYIFISTGEKQEVRNPITILRNGSVSDYILDFDERYVAYVLNEIGAWKLHNPPLSSDLPKIEFIIDNEKYSAAVDDSVIKVKRSEIDDEDLKIRTSKEALIKVILSENINEEMKKSVQDGETEIEMISSYTTLFSKGYLSLYKDLTGEELTGSVIKIFSH